MSILLKGTAFITGAASGIGRGTALSFARHGIQRLALADRDSATLKSSIQALQEQHPNVEVLPLQMDVTRTPEVRSGIAETIKKFGRLDVAVNNAGISGSGKKTLDVDEDEFLGVLDVNLHGVWRCQKEEIAVMLKQEDLGSKEGKGRIINIASLFGIVGPSPYMSHTAYTVAKHGVVGLTQADGNTYASEGVRINCICPGYTATPLLKKGMLIGENSPLSRDIAKTPLNRLATTEEIGDAITFLASPLSSYMQSTPLIVDGGFLAA